MLLMGKFTNSLWACSINKHVTQLPEDMSNSIPVFSQYHPLSNNMKSYVYIYNTNMQVITRGYCIIIYPILTHEIYH